MSRCYFLVSFLLLTIITPSFHTVFQTLLISPHQNFKMAIRDKEAVRNAYMDVRDDSTETTWVTFKYEGKDIVHEDSGVQFEDFREKFGADERGFGYLRVITGDELSKRAKFVFIVWCGQHVSGIKRARCGTDKNALKQIIQSFALEMLLTEPAELSYEIIVEECQKAGGANYGTGSR